MSGQTLDTWSSVNLGGKMNTVKTVSLVLVIIGALNWLLVGLFGFDLVATLTGETFGDRNAISSIIYVLVGIAGLALLPELGSRREVRSTTVTSKTR